MKNLLLFVPTLFISALHAQPSIANSGNLPLAGFSAPVSFANPASGVGTGGASQTWDFSTLTFTPVGTYIVVEPDSFPFGATFPSADYAYSLNSDFSLYNVETDRMEMLADEVDLIGIGTNYLPNPKTVLVFPFNFLDSHVDAYQKTGFSPDTVTVTYDGYGTFITPTNTYTDVIRVRESYGPGEDDYKWYITNPLINVGVFDHNLGILFTLSTTQITARPDAFTGNVFWGPNPANDQFMIHGLTPGATLRVIDSAGRSVLHQDCESTSAAIRTVNLPSGIYTLQLEHQGMLGHGRLVIQH